MSADSTFYAEVETTVGSAGKIEVLGRAYWSPKLCNCAGWTVRVMVPKDESDAIQVCRGAHFLASADLLIETGILDTDGAKEVARRAAAMRKLVAESGSALTAPRQADRDHPRTASRSGGGAGTPQPQLQTAETSSAAARRSKDRLHTETRNRSRPRRTELDTQPVSRGHGAAAGLSHHQEAEDRHPAGRVTIPELGPRTSPRGDGVHPGIARKHCREGRPCPRVRAALASGTKAPLRDHGDDRYSWCMLPETRWRWFICEDSEACFEAHRLRDEAVQTPKRRGIARLLSALRDLIFGRRA